MSVSLLQTAPYSVEVADIAGDSLPYPLLLITAAKSPNLNRCF